MKQAITVFITLFLLGCSSVKYEKTVDKVDLKRFMGTWYVIAARATFLESGAHNSVEIYSWNESKKRIDIDFKFNKDSFSGKLKSIPQKAWIHNSETNAHWKVQPIWPLKLDYLVIDLDENYEWVVIGVPNQKYVWIMAKEWKFSSEKLRNIKSRLTLLGYKTNDIQDVPQKW